MPELRDYQVEARDKLLQWSNSNPAIAHTLVAPMSAGKCLGYNTPVIKYDGSVIPVQDLQVGDSLMSPTGTKETITSLARGRETMYRVIPKGHAGFDEWTCNESHILSLVVWNKGIGASTGGSKRAIINGITYGLGDIVNISVKDYLALIENRSSYKEYLKLYRVYVDRFEHSKTETDLPIPAYCLGVWLGDGVHNNGSCNKLTLNNTNKVVVGTHFERELQLAFSGVTVMQRPYADTNACDWIVLDSTRSSRNRSEYRSALASCFNMKFLPERSGDWEVYIPEKYKTADYDTRLKLLAGLLDADGYYATSSFELTTTSERLAKDIQFVARSLGFLCSIQERLVTGFGKLCLCYRLRIGGNGLESIPVKRFNVQPRIAKETKNYNVNSFKLENIGEGDYYGFELDGTRLFLLGDFSVTHNTAISCNAVDHLVQQGKRVWILMDREELIDQWQNELKRFAPNLQSYGRDVGVIMGSSTPMLHRPVQVVMVQTLGRRLDKIPDKYKPDVIAIDEAHCNAFQRVATQLKQRWQNCVQINLTATPVRHGKSPVQYADIFPKETWHVVKTARQMIAAGLWKTPIWKSASDDLAEKTTIRFTGMKETGGDYDDTDQAAVMMDLLPHHLKEWQALGGDKHHCVFFCVNVEHSMQTVKALQALGRKAIAITGESNKLERKRAIEAFKKGEVNDLVNCQCLTTGFDAPIASCAVWLRKTLSTGLFQQMIGRVLRLYDGITEALMLDLAGNLGHHPLPETLDWLDFDPCMRLFRDPKLVMCQQCNHRHDAIPVPLHPSDRRTTWLTGQACFKDGLEISFNTPITCHSCKYPVYADTETLAAYGLWQKSCRAAKMAGKKQMPTYDRATAGVSIGVSSEKCQTPLTIEILYDLGIWRLSEGGEKPETPIKDRSDEYRELRIRISKRLEEKDLIDLRFELLNERQRKFLIGSHTATLKAIPDHTDRYRAAIGVAYVSNRSIVWAYPYWGDNGAIPKAETAKAFKSIWSGNPDTYKMLENWLIDWQEKHKESGSMKKYGTVTTALKILQGLSIESEQTLDVA
jgi:Type III restriction enzyme, res subunit/Hom_end-associated Hint/Helicase conserved C-terminal domain/LAGLIDADG-like domain